jgi:hypothetical protein
MTAARNKTPSTHGEAKRLPALHELVDCLDDLQPSGRVAGLRRLAEHADDLSLVLDTLAPLLWALDKHGEATWTLESLQEHRPTLRRMSDLDDLADDFQGLARDLRQARRCREEIQWTIEELEDLENSEALEDGPC